MPHKIEAVEILDKDLLWRRVLDQPAWWKKDSDGSIRLSSANFLQRKSFGALEKGVSVQLAKFTTIEKASSVIKSAGIAEIKVKYPRSIDLEVIYDPIIDEENNSKNDLAHSLIVPRREQKITKSQARKMAKEAKFILLPKHEREK